jgi:hypothetical protein
MISGLLISLFGVSMINGSDASRHCFIEVLTYLIYQFSSLMVSITSLREQYLTKHEYRLAVNMYTNLPNHTYTHFMNYPEAFLLCGWALVMYGASRTIRN